MRGAEVEMIERDIAEEDSHPAADERAPVRAPGQRAADPARDLDDLLAVLVQETVEYSAACW